MNKGLSNISTALILLACVFSSCDKKPFDDNTGSEISFSEDEVTVGADAGKAVVSLTASDAWKITGSPSWIGSVKPSSGNAGTVEITVSGRFYDGKEAREGVVTAICGDAKAELKVVQTGASSLRVSPAVVNDLSALANVFSVNVESESEYTVDLSGVSSWISLETLSLPLKGKVSFRVSANDGAPRSGDIVFLAKESVTLSVSQSGSAAYLERKALEDLYDAAAGNSWTNSSNWKSDKPLSEWYGVETDASGRVVSVELASNNLVGTLPESMNSLERLTVLKLSGNKLSGSLPDAIRLIPGWKGINPGVNVYPQQSGYGFSFRDGEVAAYSKAEASKGYDVVILGDGFDREGLSLGRGFDALVEETLDALFAIEPLASIRNCFNVYAVAAESSTTDITTAAGNTAFGTYFLSDSFSVVTMNTDKDKVNRYAGKAPVMKLSDALVILLVNTTRFGGTTLTWADGSKVCIVPAFRGGSAGNTEAQYGFAGLIQHECIGHGIGLLDEEYHTNGMTVTAAFADELSTRQALGTCLNISTTSDPSAVPWSALIGRDGVGVYEGAGNFSYGVWRSEKDCCMVDNRPYFSLWCRYLIWKRVMTTVGLDSSLESFLAS